MANQYEVLGKAPGPEELKKLYTSNSFKRKKSVIKQELTKRNAI